jgi:glycine/D-amino acid oxidase-like deaminating enzyme
MPPHSSHFDVTLLGGGAAGLFTLDALRSAGFNARLIEKSALGTGQTVCAQGIIHGGTKYSLSGLLTPAAAAIKTMPTRWRKMLRGELSPALPRTRVRADYCLLWETESLTSRLSFLGAKLALEVRPRELRDEEIPLPLKGVRGQVQRLDEPVIDPVSLLQDLASRHAGAIFSPITPLEKPAQLRELTQTLQRESHLTVLIAGAGNTELCEAVGIEDVRTQLRPLGMFMIRSKTLPAFNGHCVDFGKTRITITSDRDQEGRTVWQLGGDLAEQAARLIVDGEIPRGAFEELNQRLRKELFGCFPGYSWPEDLEWACYPVSRAEAHSKSAIRHELPKIEKRTEAWVAWPSKLALAPLLADQIVEEVQAEWKHRGILPHHPTERPLLPDEAPLKPHPLLRAASPLAPCPPPWEWTHVSWRKL